MRIRKIKNFLPAADHSRVTESQIDKWSGRWESNPQHQLGRLRLYHLTTPAL